MYLSYEVLFVCGVRNWSLMVFVLFVKKVAKSSAVRVEKEEGEEDREEKKHFEECARVGTVVNLSW